MSNLTPQQKLREAIVDTLLTMTHVQNACLEAVKAFEQKDRQITQLVAVLEENKLRGWHRC